MECSASRVLAATTLIGVLATPLAAQQREPAAIPTVLAKALISPFFGVLGRQPRFVVGRAPTGWKSSLDAGASVKVVGGVDMGSFRAVVYRFSSSEAVTAYRERLLHSGFTPSALQSPRGGFTSGETQHPEQFCGPDGIVIVSEVDSSRTSRSVLVTLLSQAAATEACRSPDVMGERPAPLDIPPLTAPVGATANPEGTGWSGNNMSTSVRLDTALSSGEILDHYVGQLARAGWTAGPRLVDATRAMQMVSAYGRDGRIWSGALMVITADTRRSANLSMWRVANE